MLRIALLVLLVVAIGLPAEAKPKKKHSSSPVRQEVKSDYQFSPAERNLIRSYLLSNHERVRVQPQALPPGLQKKVARGKSLPPGWQKKVGAGDHLDYQVYRHGTSLPEELLKRLPVPPPGSEIINVEDTIIRIDPATRLILDVFDLILTN